MATACHRSQSEVARESVNNDNYKSRLMIEKSLEPLVAQVTTLQENLTKHNRRKTLRNIHQITQIVTKAVENFIVVGEQIAMENADFQDELMLACENIRSAQHGLQMACKEYTVDSLESRKRELMEDKARELILTVTRLLILVDLVDINQLMKASNEIQNKLSQLRKVKSWDMFVESVKLINEDLQSVSERASARQEEIKSTAAQQLLVLAHAELKQCNQMLITSTKIFLEHPEDENAQENRDYVIQKMQEAIQAITCIADGTTPILEEHENDEQPSQHTSLPTSSQNLATSIQNFETMLERSAQSTKPVESPQNIQVGFDIIMAAAANLASSDSTRDQHGLLAQCDVVREKLQNFFSVLTTKDNMNQIKEKENEEQSLSVHQSAFVVEEETATLRAELRRAMIDHVSDTFVDPFVPLTRLVLSAQSGCLDESLNHFTAHTENLIHVSNLVCTLTSDNDSTRQVRVVSQQLKSLKDQIVYAAKTLAAYPESEAAQKNMDAFEEAWIDKVTLLTESIDTVIPIQDFIAVTEAHVREDSRYLMEKIECGDVPIAIGCANVIQGRCQRLIQVILSDIGNNPTRYSHEHVHEIEQQMSKLEIKTLSEFQNEMSKCSEKRKSKPLYETELRKLEDHLQLINDSIRDIRKYILKTRTKEELNTEPDIDDIISPAPLTAPSSNDDLLFINQTIKPPSPILHQHGSLSPKIELEIEEVTLTKEQFNAIMGFSSGSTQLEDIIEETEEAEEQEPDSEKKVDISHMTNTLQRRLIKRTPSVAVINESETAQAMMAQLPASEQARIAKAQEKLNDEKQRLESEVNKWDDSSNDIVLLAKEMCWMMMDMSDFTRGIGPLKSTIDVINTAKDIARAGEYLEQLVKQVSDLCPDENCQKDLLAYLDRIRLCCHQLKITSAVIADLGASVKEKVETASNLIGTAKNLMNVVVQVVKSCYIASVSIAKKQGLKPVHFMQWQLMSPKKKLLYSSRESFVNTHGMYRETPRNSISPIKALGDFKGLHPE